MLDFGIAKVQTEETHTSKLTHVGAVFGTPEYMSPEQAMGQTVDHRSDLYAAGIILYEMLTGQTPFAGGTMAAILTRHMTADPPPLPASIPAALRHLVTTLLKKHADERIPSARALSERLQKVKPSELPASRWAMAKAKLAPCSNAGLFASSLARGGWRAMPSAG